MVVEIKVLFLRKSIPPADLLPTKIPAGLLTFRFVTNGHFIYAHRGFETIASKSIAVLADFDSLHEIRSTSSVSAVGATIAVETLANAQKALTGDEHIGLSTMKRVADMNIPRMSALFCTILHLRRRIDSFNEQADHMLPLLQELIGYHRIFAWPEFSETTSAASVDLTYSQLQLAIDFIETYLSSQLMLAKIAVAVGNSVRLLHDKFKSELDQTPVKFIVD